MNLLAPADLFLFSLNLVLLAFAVWALADAVIRPAAAFPAAGKLTKPVWVAILALCVGMCLLGFGLLGLIGGLVAVAVIVYLVDVRPAVRGTGPYR